jgi:hypothetical protein
VQQAIKREGTKERDKRGKKNKGSKRTKMGGRIETRSDPRKKEKGT